MRSAAAQMSNPRRCAPSERPPRTPTGDRLAVNVQAVPAPIHPEPFGHLGSRRHGHASPLLSPAHSVACATESDLGWIIELAEALVIFSL